MNRQDAKNAKEEQEKNERKNPKPLALVVLFFFFLFFSLSFLGFLGVLAVHLVRGSNWVLPISEARNARTFLRTHCDSKIPEKTVARSEGMGISPPYDL